MDVCVGVCVGECVRMCLCMVHCQFNNSEYSFRFFSLSFFLVAALVAFLLLPLAESGRKAKSKAA